MIDAVPEVSRGYAMETQAASPNSPSRVATLTGLFAASVGRYPQRAAVSDDHQTLTYAELDGRADRVAAQLLARGVRPQDRVGLYLDRSVDAVVAILGILKAGGAYVAVDARYPDAGRDHMLSSSDPRLVVTRPGWEGRLAHLELDVVGFRSGPAGTERGPRPCTRVAPEWAASVVFTAGSSGRPNGVVLEHRNICSFATNPSLPALSSEDRTGQISSLSFDACHFEVWSTLTHGAEVVILPPVAALLAADFHREMQRRRITALLLPTMVVNQVLREDRDAFAPLRILQAGCDVLLPAACRDLFAGDFRGELYNLYGPAETTTACTVQRVTPAEAVLGSVPIGRPLSGVTVHVLNPEKHPAGPGQVGEVYVGGPGVARGYLGQPRLTAERFVQVPLPDGAARLYRTGDLARRNPDGILEFIGRVDDQLEIRGHRVEPGEVERALTRHREVQEVAVLASGPEDDKQLVAFTVLAEPLTPKRLREYAEAELPDFLVPSHFVQLPELPINDHGKRDPAALQRLLAEHRSRRDRFVAPATETERYLAAVWEDLLGVETVGGNDDFFGLGGHSLLAFRLNSRIKRELAVPVEHSLIVRNSVLSDLAARIDELKQGGALL